MNLFPKMNSDKINIDAQPTDALMYQQRIIFALIRRRMNILQLAESADMSIIELNEIMEGQMPSITLSQAARIAAALDMSMHDLMLGP